MIDEISEEVKERAKARTQENIRNLLKELDELDKKDPYIDDPFEDEYDKKIYEGDNIRTLDNYKVRRDNVRPQWEELKAEARIEARNGYMRLPKGKKYEIFIKRRIEAEKILQEAYLSHRDTMRLREGEKEGEKGLVATLVELYEIYGLRELDKKDDKKETSDEE